MVAKIDLTSPKLDLHNNSPAFIPYYEDKSRYQILWGGAGSGKSHKVARRILIRCFTEKHNYLIVRKVNRTLKRSVFTLMKNIISVWCSNWGIPLSRISDVNLTDLTIKFPHNGSQIMFTGLDDVEKLKSIEGVTSVWCEEATELLQEDFEQLDLRLRGDHGVTKQVTITFNPISDQHWLKRVFFDDPIEDVFTLKTTFLDNKFIDDDYKMVMENKKKTNPRYYNIYALGNWGTAEGLIFSNVKQRLIREHEIQHLECVQGLDFGYTNDPTSFNVSYVDTENKVIYVFDGFYGKGMSNQAISENIKKMQRHKHSTIADSSEPKSIDSLISKGCRVLAAKKGRDSINAGIDFLLDYEIIVNAHLVEFWTEFMNYSWAVDNKSNKPTNKPNDDFNHFIDSLRYATEKFQSPAHIARPKMRMW